MIKTTRLGQKEFHGFCKWCGLNGSYILHSLGLGSKIKLPHKYENKFLNIIK